jgi:hypothetical protein
MIISFYLCIFLFLTLKYTCYAIGFLNTSTLNCRNQYWLHIPKTSSAFCLSLQHVCCLEQFEASVSPFNTTRHVVENEILNIGEKYFTIETNHGCAYLKSGINRRVHLLSCRVRTFGHKPYSPTFSFMQKQALVVLRHPKSRVFSAFNDDYHHEGMNYQEFDNLKTRMFNDSSSREVFQSRYPGVRETVMVFVYGAFVYLNDPMILGCQTKMILGYHCADSQFILPRNPINMTLIEEAKKRLRQFYFLGIFEEYQKTIELFHRISSNGTTIPSVVELLPIRQSNQSKARVLRAYFSNYSDPYDDALYEEGKKIFSQRYNALFHSEEHQLLKTDKKAVEIPEIDKNMRLDLKSNERNRNVVLLSLKKSSNHRGKSESVRNPTGNSNSRVISDRFMV